METHLATACACLGIGYLSYPIQTYPILLFESQCSCDSSLTYPKTSPLFVCLALARFVLPTIVSLLPLFNHSNAFERGKEKARARARVES